MMACSTDASKKTKALVERIAFIRETHYGKFWEVHANLEHGDTAYTNLAISLHTDTTYFTDPVGSFPLIFFPRDFLDYNCFM